MYISLIQRHNCPIHNRSPSAHEGAILLAESLVFKINTPHTWGQAEQCVNECNYIPTSGIGSCLYFTESGVLYMYKYTLCIHVFHWELYYVNLKFSSSVWQYNITLENNHFHGGVGSSYPDLERCQCLFNSKEGMFSQTER